MKTNEDKKEFYARCSEILGIEHEWNDPVPRRTRWNNRLLGNGRFPGFGLIRCIGNGAMITSKDMGSRTYDTYEEVYAVLTQYMEMITNVKS